MRLLKKIETPDDDTGAPLPWALQTIQDTVSMAGMVPLRLFDMDRAEKIWAKAPESAREIPLKDSVETIIGRLLQGLEENKGEWKRGGEAQAPVDLKNLMDFFSNRQHSGWNTRPSYPHPLLNNFRQYHVFQLYEQVLTFAWIKKYEKANENEKDIFKSYKMLSYKGFLLCVNRLNVEGRRLYLVVGPVIVASERPADLRPEEDEGQTALHSEVNDVIDVLVAFIEGKQGASEHLPRVSKEIWHVLSRLRPYWRSEELAEIADHSAAALASALNTDWPSPHTDRPYLQKEYLWLTRTLCRRVALAAWAIHSHTFNRNMERLALKSGNGCWHKIINEIQPCVPLTTNTWVIKIEFLKDAGPFSLRVAQCPSAEDRASPDMMFASSSPPVGVDADSFREAAKSFSGFYQSVHRRVVSLEESYTHERLLWLLQWFRQEFGLILSPDQPNLPQGGKDALKRLSSYIAYVVAAIVSADIGDLYFYDYSSEAARLMGCYVDVGVDGNDETRKELLKMLEKVEYFDLVSRDQSVNYRVIRKMEASYCRSAIKNENGEWVFDPKGESIVEENLKYLRSAISVPLFLNNRILGVLGVAGRAPYQFRRQKVEVLKRFSQLVVPYIYQTILTQAMADLTREALSTSKRHKTEIYNAICEQFSRVFLSRAAILWMPQEPGKDKFYPSGYTSKVPTLKEAFSRDPGKPIIWDSSKKGSMLFQAMKTIEKQGVFGTAFIDDIATANGWFEKSPLRGWLRVDDINGLTAIPVHRAGNNGERGPLLAVLALYYKKPHDPLSGLWKSVIAHMASFLALLLDALDERTDLVGRVELAHYLCHDLPAAIGSTKDGFNNIISGIDTYLSELNNKPSAPLLEGGIRDLPLAESPATTVGSKCSWIVERLSRFENMAGRIAEKGNYRNVLEDKYPHLKGRHIKGVQPSKHNLKQILTNLIGEAGSWPCTAGKPVAINLNNMCPEKASPPIVMAHVGEVEEILQYLIENAVKYSIEGRAVSITLKIAFGLAVVVVRNICMPLEEGDNKETLCKPEFLGANAKAKGKKGGGNGLYYASSLSRFRDFGFHLDWENVKDDPDGYCEFAGAASFPLSLED